MGESWATTSYSAARWLSVAMRNGWLTPGWSRSWHTAAMRAASFSSGVRCLRIWKHEPHTRILNKELKINNFESYYNKPPSIQHFCIWKPKVYTPFVSWNLMYPDLLYLETLCIQPSSTLVYGNPKYAALLNNLNTKYPVAEYLKTQNIQPLSIWKRLEVSSRKKKKNANTIWPA